MKAPAPPSRFKGNSTSAALAVAAAVMLVPANVLPVLNTLSAGRSQSDTIVSGAVALWKQGSWAIAVVVFTASVLIPGFKLAGLGWLLLGTGRPGFGTPKQLSRIYSIVDFVGRWSMLDVFLAALLMGLIQFGELSTVTPKIGLVAFAAVVVLTVLSTQWFDPRVLWSAPAR